MVQKEVKKKTSVYGATAVLLAIILVSIVYVVGTVPIIFPSQAPTASGMKTFSSNQAIVDYLNSNTNTNNYASNYYGGPLDNQFFNSESIVTPTQTGSFGTDKSNGAGEYVVSSPNAYSTTNIQVAGVDEADTVKTDGRFIYTVSNAQTNRYWFVVNTAETATVGNALNVVDADSSNAHVVSKITLDSNVEPAGLFLSSDGNRLVVIASKYQYYLYNSHGNALEPMIMPSHQADVYTFIYVYDVSDKSYPTLCRNLTVSGSYFDSRMIGDNVYTVVSQTAWVYNNVVSLPVAYEDDVSYDASPSNVYYADMNDTSYTFTSFYGVDIQNDAVDATNMTVLMGGASVMYVSSDNLYVTYADWDQSAGQYTSVYKVAINGLQLSLAAQGSVPGYTLNQYSLDESNGYFRLATNWYGDEGQMNNVYVLNSDLTVAGKLEGLAPNEDLHSARFIGDRCYLVTFRTVDPLFVVDLSIPTNPRLMGELKVTGYSDYLYPYDETHLIGVGKEAVESDGTAYYQGVKLALFDVSEVNNPVQLSAVTIGDRGSDSDVLSNPKAFLFDKSKNLLVIPVSVAVVNEADKQQYGNSAYGSTVWQGAYVYTVTSQGFTLKGTITHLNSTLLGSDGNLSNSYDYYNSQNQWITRALYIGNTLYTVSNSEVKLNSLSDLSEVATVSLS